MPRTDVRGRFLWHELMTTDVDKAAAFYPKVVSWKTQPWPQDKNYTMWMSDRGPVGGLMTQPIEAAAKGAPPNWLLYIGTPNVDETVNLAQRLGARVLRPAHDVATIGRFAVLADPQGVTFAIYSPSSPSTSIDAATKLGEFSWHELATDNGEDALRFYQLLFGWELMQRMDMGPMGFYNIFGWKETQRGGVYSKPKDRTQASQWVSYAQVASADAAAAAAKSAGARVIAGPMDVPGGSRIAMFIDPQGAAFAVHSMAPAAKTATPQRARAAAKPDRKKKVVKRAAKAGKTKSAQRPAKRKAKRSVRAKKK